MKWTLLQYLVPKPAKTLDLDSSISTVVHPPRKVPVSLKEKIEEEVDRMETAEVAVKQKEPTDWVNGMVAVVKPNKLRICIDPPDLNEAISREHFPMTNIEEVVADMKPPENAKELKAFLGFIQYLGKFTPNMATERAPLRELLEKNVAWHWDHLQEESFQKLKQMASSTPILGY